MYSEITERVRKLRNNPTKAEDYLWRFLNNKKLGAKFLRQKPIIFYWGNQKRYFIADFFCKEANLVIEIDGKIHENQKEYDEAREYVLKHYGFNIVRFTNTNVLKNTEDILNEIKELLIALPRGRGKVAEGRIGAGVLHDH